MTTALVLLSGGIDSAAALHCIRSSGATVEALFVSYGQPAETPERLASAAIAAHYRVHWSEISIGPLAIPSTGEIVGRNLLLVSTALAHVGRCAGVIVLGVHAGTPYYDCGVEFLSDLGRQVEAMTTGAVRLHAPFAEWSKASIVSYAVMEGVPIDLTYSCEAGGVEPCGACLSCRDRGGLHAAAP